MTLAGTAHRVPPSPEARPRRRGHCAGSLGVLVCLVVSTATAHAQAPGTTPNPTPEGTETPAKTPEPDRDPPAPTDPEPPQPTRPAPDPAEQPVPPDAVPPATLPDPTDESTTPPTSGIGPASDGWLVPPAAIFSAPDDEARGFAQAPRTRSLRGRFLLRGLGRVAKLAARVFIVTPVRSVAYLQARWKIFTRIRDVFQNDAGTLAIYPNAAYSTAFGPTLGATAFYKDFFAGNDEKISASGAWGGDVVKAYQLTFDLPQIAGGRWYARTLVRWEENRNVPFAGVGNGGATTGTDLDARAGSAKVAFSQERFLATTSGGIALGRPGRRTRIGLTAIFNERRFGPAPTEAVSIEEVYDTSTLSGFDAGFRNLETTLDLEYDTRDPLGGRGHVARGFLGGAGLARGYGHYGLELAYHVQPFWPDRVLVGRIALEGVYTRGGEIPFTELPRLGGVGQLRGFGTDQFRDRLSTIGSLEYRYPIHANLAGHLFVELGKVARTYDELVTTGIDHWHLGYGGGVIIRTASAVKFRLAIGHGVGSGLQFYFSTDVLDAFRRREREL